MCKMRFFVGWFVTLIFLLNPVVGFSQLDSNEIIIPFELRGHAILLDTKVNDSPKTFKFAFDTGGKITINPILFEEMNIIPERSVYVSILDWTDHKYIVDSIRIGPIRKEKLKLYSLEAEGREFYDRMDGILGPNLFRGYRYTIDYINQQIILSNDSEPLQPDSNSILVKYSVWNLRRTMEIDLIIADSIKVKGMLDTGCPVAIILPRSYVENKSEFFGQPVIKSKGIIIEPVFGAPEECFLSRAPSIKIGNHEFRNIPSYFYGDETYIGKELLLPFKTTFDRKRSQIMMVPHEEEKHKTNIRSYGVQFSFEDSNHVLVKGLWEGSPADSAGIEVGDELLEVNGRKVSEYSHYGLYEPFRNKDVDEIELLMRTADGERRVLLKSRNLLPEIKAN